MDTIYTVTTTSERDKVFSRCVGWFMNIGEAMESVIKNYGDISEEGYYNYCVIEEVGSGLYYAFSRKELWFEWKEDNYELLENKPEHFKNICNFSMG